MLGLVVAHLVLACLLPLVSARSRRAGVRGGGACRRPPRWSGRWRTRPRRSTTGVSTTLDWAPALGLALSFRLDALALAMVVLVSGIGAVILVYCIGYFGETSPDGTRSAALLLAFAGVMLGLVLADDLLTLYVFWELTSMTSFLLVGQSGERAGEPRRRGAGAAGHGVRRAGDAARLRPARRGGGHLPDLGDRRARAGRRARRRLVTDGARADPRRRADEVRAAARSTRGCPRRWRRRRR